MAADDTGRTPFSEPSQPEWIYTSTARIECASCGEWIYARRRREPPHGSWAFPPECQVCGAPTPEETL